MIDSTRVKANASRDCIDMEQKLRNERAKLRRQVERQCGAPPDEVLADAGFFSLENVRELERRGIDGYMPDSIWRAS